MKKQIDMLTQILEKNNISLPDCSKKREGYQIQRTEREYMLWLLEIQGWIQKTRKKAKNPPKQNRDKNKSQEELQGSKKNFQKKKNKGEMRKCAYCSKRYHPEISCMKKQINMLTELLEKNNISLPDCSKKREGGSNSEDRESTCIGCWHIKLT